MFSKTIGIIFMGIMLTMAGCSYKKDLPASDDCTGATISFSAQIQPLIETRCAINSCHNAISTNRGGPFTSYALIKNKALTIKQQVVGGIMPQGGSLTATEIKMIRCWVDAGAPEN